ncbi:MAG: HAMP domain-containing histidine kinase [Clostridiales bacterium]|nr:HAMP domain-containing histidine kinase [Clostridiales bacterium]
MIKKLQKRFILIAMCAVFVVLAIIMGIINTANYFEMLKDSDRTMSVLEANGGFFPHHEGEKQKPPMPGMSPEAPFETRFFTVYLDENGRTANVNTGSIAAISRNEAVEYAEKVYGSGKERGFLDVYRYSISKTENGSMVIFLDISRGLNYFRNFLRTSLEVSFAGILGVFIIVLLLSKKAIKPIADSYEKQKRFITDAGHELKTPLTVISANTEILEMTQGENEWTQSIRNQTARLSELTNSLVSLARMDEENSKLMMTDFSISDAVLESFEPFIQMAEHQGKTVEMSVQRNLTYAGNEESIRKLASILADNAVKYSEAGGRIWVTFRQSKNIVFQVKNSVERIEKGNHDEIFERFYRGDSSRNSETGGYGLGLSIAKAIGAAHKGKITARSEDGKSLEINVQL